MFISIIGLLVVTISIINIIQSKKASILPVFLQSWMFLPIYLRSLEPYDKLIKQCGYCFNDSNEELVSESNTLDSNVFKENLPGELVVSKDGKDIFTVSNLYFPEYFVKLR